MPRESDRMFAADKLSLKSFHFWAMSCVKGSLEAADNLFTSVLQPITYTF